MDCVYEEITFWGVLRHEPEFKNRFRDQEIAS